MTDKPDAATLKPCPFCGEPARMWGSQGRNGLEMAGCPSIICQFQPATDYMEESAAISQWNTRAGDLVERAQAVKVKPLVFPERRNGYWGHHKDGYQVAHTTGDIFRVRLHGKVICKNIKGFGRAVAWANNHHNAAILAALEPAPDVRADTIRNNIGLRDKMACIIAGHELCTPPFCDPSNGSFKKANAILALLDKGQL